MDRSVMTASAARMVKRCLAGLVFMGFAAPAIAQSTGTIIGTIVDQTGGVLRDVSVELAMPGGEYLTHSDAAGRYRFDSVASGTGVLTFRMINFTTVRRDIRVAAGTVSADATLSLSLSADVVVTGTASFRNVADVANPSDSLIGIASAASQGAVTAAQLMTRPLMRTGEVLEAVPGMVVSQHGGEGKANQYYLRGFNLDHGTDFSTTIAGVPVNAPTGAHAHGYSDIAFLIPELVSGVQYKKGPYFADEGDFSAAGAANINYVNVLDVPSVRVSGGDGQWRRLFAAASPRIGDGHLLMAGEVNHNDGPWERPDNYNKVNAVLRYSRGDTRNGLSISATGYRATWDSTDQVPQRATASGVISRFGLVDTTDRGYANRESLAVELQRSFAGAVLRGNAFVLHNRLNLFSNFTYYLDDPIHGDQFEQAEQRVASGGRLGYHWLSRLFGRRLDNTAGLQVRHDRLAPVGLYKTAQRRRLSTTREDRVSQALVGLYGQSEVDWSTHVRSTVGMRVDTYALTVRADNHFNSGSRAAAIVSPKAALAFGPWRGTEVYLNAGFGFHSNDARGVVIAVDPRSGEPASPATPLVKARGSEIGVRSTAIPHVQSTVALWYLRLDSELLFVGDAGTSEASSPSRRAGIEWATHWRIQPWLTADGDLAFSTARFAGAESPATAIPGALNRVISAGLSFEPSRRPWSGSIRLRHFGPRPLIDDRSVESPSSTLWNATFGYRLSRQTRLVGEAFNLFDAKVSDIDYYYTSRLPGEPAEGIADIHTHPALPRSIRLGLHVEF